MRRGYVNPRLPNPTCSPAVTRSRAKMAEGGAADDGSGNLSDGPYGVDLGTGARRKTLLADPLPPEDYDRTLSLEQYKQEFYKEQEHKEMERQLAKERVLAKLRLARSTTQHGQSHLTEPEQTFTSPPKSKSTPFSTLSAPEASQQPGNRPGPESDSDDDGTAKVTQGELESRMKYLTALAELQKKEQEILSLRQRLQSERARV